MQPAKKGQDLFPFIVIFSFAVMHLINNYLWLQKDAFPLWNDFGAYFNRSLDLYKIALKSPELFTKALLGIGGYATTYHPYRFIMPLTSVPFYFLLPPSADLAVLSLSVFFLLLVVGVFLVTREMSSDNAGVLAGFIVMTTPGIFWLSRHYLPEFPCAALATVAIFLLIRTDEFSSRSFSAILGLTIAAGLLTKETFLVYVISPFLYVFYRGLRQRRDVARRLCNCGFCLLLSSLALIVYFLNMHHVRHQLSVPFAPEILSLYQSPQIFSPGSLLFYGIRTINFGASFLHCLLFLIMFFVILRNNPPGAKTKIGVIFWWIIGSYLMLSLVPLKNEAYFNPFYPSMAVVISIGIFRIKARVARNLSVGFLILFGCFQLYTGTYAPIRFLPLRYQVRCAGETVVVFQQSERLLPQPQDWKSAQIIQYIDSLQKKLSPVNNKILLICDIPYLNVPILEYYANLSNLNLIFYGLPHYADIEEIESRLRDADFVITKTGNLGVTAFSGGTESVIDHTLHNTDMFSQLPEHFSMPDGSRVSFFKNNIKNSMN
jgi:4-amino-4-deoxy-L-arabinose transferase-like glycosyltransferase